MKMSFLILVAFSLFTTFTNPLSAKPLDEKQKQELKSPTNENLRDQMNKMIISIADLDILANRDETADFEIFIEDADRILKAIAEIRKLDKAGIYTKLLDDLETPTRKLKELSLEKNQKAMEMPEQIFNACFQCHQTHRKS